jgi:hypothetical protein
LLPSRKTLYCIRWEFGRNVAVTARAFVTLFGAERGRELEAGQEYFASFGWGERMPTKENAALIDSVLRYR